MAKQFWETDIVTNNFGKPSYNNDCEITIVELGSIREWTSPQGTTFMYQKLVVLGQNDVKVDTGIELTYTKGETPVTPDMLNKPLACRIKTAPDNTQYGLNGRKYTVAIGEKKASGSGGRGSRGGYTPPTPEEARGKVKHGVVCAAIESSQLKCSSLDDVLMYTDFIMKTDD